MVNLIYREICHYRINLLGPLNKIVLFSFLKLQKCLKLLNQNAMPSSPTNPTVKLQDWPSKYICCPDCIFVNIVFPVMWDILVRHIQVIVGPIDQTNTAKYSSFSISPSLILSTESNMYSPQIFSTLKYIFIQGNELVCRNTMLNPLLHWKLYTLFLRNPLDFIGILLRLNVP